MPSIAGKYQHYKNENYDEYFASIGIPFMARKMMGMSSPVMEITVDGEHMTIKISSLLRTVENKFTLGEEYEEEMPGKTIIKSVTKMLNDNELITESIITETGEKTGRNYHFTDEECVITLTHYKAISAKRYFKRVIS